jgi:hypothetical protein
MLSVVVVMVVILQECGVSRLCLVCFGEIKEYIHIDVREGGYLGDLVLDVMIVLKATLKKIWTGIRLVQNKVQAWHLMLATHF